MAMFSCNGFIGLKSYLAAGKLIAASACTSSVVAMSAEAP